MYVIRIDHYVGVFLVIVCLLIPYVKRDVSARFKVCLQMFSLSICHDKRNKCLVLFHTSVFVIVMYMAIKKEPPIHSDKN